MKLTTILLIVTLVQVSAKGLGQNISIEGQNIPIKEVIKSIESQSPYTFFYDTKDLPEANVTLSLKDATINEALDAIFRSIPDAAYKVVNGNVLITRVENQKNVIVKGNAIGL